jgi:hypothetical protein
VANLFINGGRKYKRIDEKIKAKSKEERITEKAEITYVETAQISAHEIHHYSDFCF